MTLVGAACGGDDDTDSSTATTVTETTAAKESTVTVEVDAKKTGLPMHALAYFPEAVTVRAGDTVKFHSNDTGEPHTVTLGSIVDDGLNAFNALPDEIKNADGPPDEAAIAKLPADQQKAVKDALSLDEKLPSLLPEGPGDANQLAANPCFSVDAPPTDKACPKDAQPAFDGKQAVYNSGYLPGDAVFEVKLADDIAPGTYNYFCLLHRQGMTGTITVVDEGTEVPSAAEVAEAGEKELERYVSKLRPQAAEMAKLPSDKAVAGAPPLEGEEDFVAGLNVFGPEEIEAKVGKPVVWTVSGPHTIAIDAPQDAVGAMVRAPDGTWHANEKAFAPVGGAGAPPPPEGPPDPKAPPVVVDGGTYGGSGFHSSGLILSFGPPGYQYKLSFAKAGTYQIACQIHPDMKGTVKVT